MSTTNYSDVTKNFSAVAVQVFEGDLEFTERHPPGLTAAILHLSGHYLEDISQADLAEISCISASHLSHLFRSILKIRFKGLLVQLRLQYAVSLLKDNPEIEITDLYLQSGFGDLSNFEKMFRRYLGRDVRVVRRMIMEQQMVAA